MVGTGVIDAIFPHDGPALIGIEAVSSVGLEGLPEGEMPSRDADLAQFADQVAEHVSSAAHTMQVRDRLILRRRMQGQHSRPDTGL